ncbi:MAG: patatin-like phospholipase family protein [Planctomycetes bacterium]|jgi:hypothetical protein|nr:patatin-like phospholipase family protein [Planctomycetota bacterium]
MRHLTSLLLLLLLVACGSVHERNAVPEPLAREAVIPGIPGARILFEAGRDDLASLTAFLSKEPQAAVAGRHLHLLAVSGGGDNGAFGAGILCGWTERKDRPEFDIVTGISTGGLTAPFAFLGSTYDARLRESFTTITADDIYESRGIFSILGHRDAVADSEPLVRMIEKVFTAEDLVAVAREHARGRRLYIGTTYMDGDCLAIWDMGAIAASGQPGALDLFRKVMLASASIPIAFPPVYFDVEAGDRIFEEMHADGGMATQVFGAGFLGPMLARQGAGRQGTVYVIRNATLTPKYEAVPARMASLGGRAISSLIRMQGIGDLLRNHRFTSEEGVGFRLAYIPGEFNAPKTGEFDQSYMNALFDFAYARARTGYPWHTNVSSLGMGD